MSETREFWRKTLFQTLALMTGFALNWTAAMVGLDPCSWVPA